MKVVCGIDVVFIPDFKESIKVGGSSLLSRIFDDSELENMKIDHLAGVFASKEAVVKALGIKVGNWKSINIRYQKTGKPIVVLKKSIKATTFSCDLSISHSGDYATAVFVALVVN